MIRKLAFTTAIVTVVFTVGVTAHEGVKDPDVKARMQLMSSVGATTKALGEMAKSGNVDTAKVVENANALAAHAAQIEAKFIKQATDPKSEALPEIWTDMDGFLKIAKQLEDAAQNLAGAPDDLQAGMKEIGASCSACHKSYRIKK